MRFLLIISTILAMVGCSASSENKPSEAQPDLTDAQYWVDQAIAAHGGDDYQRADMRFVFRDKGYRSLRNKGGYRYERNFEKEGDSIQDVLTNGDFTRYLNGKEAVVADTMADKYANSVNSVLYFAQLPFGLNDGAVIKAFVGMESIKGGEYAKIQVKFQEEGGGKDFEDVFYYWIHPDQFTVDYLAYEYHTDGGGIRFREAYNARVMEGIRFQDYVNYKADPAVISLEETGKAFEAGKLKELSRIETENIQVSLSGR